MSVFYRKETLIKASTNNKANGNSHLNKCKITLSVMLITLFTAANLFAKDNNKTKYIGADYAQRLSQPLMENSNVRKVELGLEECIQRALKNNLDLKIGQYDPAIQMTDVVQAEAVFDAVLFGSATHDSDDRGNVVSDFFTQTVTTQNGVETRKVAIDPYVRTHDTNYAMGLRKLLPTGATVSIAQTLRRFRDLVDGDQVFFDPFYEYSLNVELRQPLLRDFGIDLNRAAINAAQNNFRISQLQFQILVINTVTEVENNYWTLSQARQQVMIFQDMIQQAEENLKRLEERQNYDVRVTIIARNASTLNRFRAQLVSATNAYLQRQDRLLESLNDPELPLDEQIELLLIDSPSSEKFELDRDKAIHTGLKMRPELAAQKIQLNTADLQIGVAENQVLPRLDLLLSNEFNGADTTTGGAWDEQNRLNTMNFRAGISFEVPLGGNRAAKANLKSAKLQKLQESLRLQGLRDQVITDVNITLHNLNSAFDELKARKDVVLSEQDTLNSYLIQEKANAVISADFLNRKIDTIERLSTALLSAIASQTNYNRAIIDANRAQGVLLRYNNIKLAELEE